MPETHKHLQAQGPVSKVALPAGQPDAEAWLVTGHAEASRVYRDSDLFVRGTADGIAPFLKAAPIIIALDGEEHRRIRSLVKGTFSPAKVRRLRPAIEDLANALLDEMIAKGEPADLVAEFAMSLTLRVIGRQFAIPEADFDELRAWNEAIVSVSPDAHQRAPAAMQAMVEYMVALMRERVHDPGEDLVSAVALNAKAAGVDEASAGLLAASVVTGGWESTGGALVCFTHRLLTTKGADGESLYSQLTRDPAIIPTAVEELLRIVPNGVLGATQPRRATRDTELGGVHIRAGDLVIPSSDAAGRDPQVFSDPEGIDLTRSPNPHLAFGSGAHVCLGAPLGRLELQVAFESLTRRLPALRLAVPADELEWRWDAGFIRRPATYPVAWNPASGE
ncbi:biflaviolin synthase [Actinomadura pelletieri DSM 43383]|uniref:Biflaviolin synthase n=1 Tax=Actinomadura pelletieri DSM 43383 TaxID=1120940 RepID=A0A495QA16_9ACTN|nr:cytochrome P450 [Actinomadura pelletieri]RKS68146.1 biflaviolin synthase [Actinomadura pelletieri DSM 43383]